MPSAPAFCRRYTPSCLRKRVIHVSLLTCDVVSAEGVVATGNRHCVCPEERFLLQLYYSRVTIFPTFGTVGAMMLMSAVCRMQICD